MKKHFYCYRAHRGEFGGEAVVWVCTIISGIRVARGVSVLGRDDLPDARHGRRQALHRALHALKGRGDERIQDQRAIDTIVTTDCPFVLHSEANPDLTFQERKALGVPAVRRSDSRVIFGFTTRSGLATINAAAIAR